jgi:hypothetical protein
MLFDIDQDGNVFSQDPRITSVPEFKDLYKAKGFGAPFIKWLVMVYDYESPYRRKLDLDERITSVNKDVFGQKKVEKLTDPLVSAAVDKYLELQYDPIQEQYDLYMLKLRDFNKLLREWKTSDPKVAKELQDAMLTNEKVVDATLAMRQKIEAMRRQGNQKKGKGGISKTFLEENLGEIHQEIRVNG